MDGRRRQPYTLANVCLAAALLCHARSRLALAAEGGSWLTALCWALDSTVLFAAATLSKAAALPSLVRAHRFQTNEVSHFSSLVFDTVATPLHPFDESLERMLTAPHATGTPQAIFALVDVLLFPDLLHNIPPRAGQTPTDRTAAWRTVVVMTATYVGSGVAAVLAVGNSLVANATHVEAEPPQHNDGQGARTTLCTEDAWRVSAWLGG